MERAGEADEADKADKADEADEADKADEADAAKGVKRRIICARGGGIALVPQMRDVLDEQASEDLTSRVGLDQERIRAGPAGKERRQVQERKSAGGLVCQRSGRAARTRH
jgi:hypothetical protein